MIVESPAKAKTISRMLGKDFQIFASMGHVRDLPEHSFGVDIKNGFNPGYVETKNRGNVLKQLRTAAKGAAEIYLAPDPDREGEAIAWHLYEALKASAKKAEFRRVTFHEITKSAIERAFQHAGVINMDLVNSQQARRVLDRLVGYMISPLVRSRIEKGSSAGRVQSVALRMVVEREREILAFIPEEYWNFIVKLSASGSDAEAAFESKLVKIDGEKANIGNGDDAAKTLKALEAAGSWKVSSFKQQPRNRYAQPPFITSTMQQAASGNLGFSASRTMRIAQQLYEGIDLGSGGATGLITYMRTDSVNVAREAQDACLDFIRRELGAEYVPGKPNSYKSKSSAQEAHEAIRPTDVELTPELARQFLDDAQFKLYSLIWRRFVASQMSPAVQAQTSVEVDSRGGDGKLYTVRTVATVTTFQGFLKVYRLAEIEEDLITPELIGKLREGDVCEAGGVSSEQKFTEPPPRFSEATLIRELEANGIGRPSTYATIVNTIQNRLYVLKENGRLYPSELGFKVNDFLVGTLPELFKVSFTAQMETRLDEIEEGKLSYLGMLETFYNDFSKWIGEAKDIGAQGGDKAAALIGALGSVTEWNAPEKRGRRVYDDRKFYESVKEKFGKDGKLSARQWQALLRLGVVYATQVKGLDAVASEHNFTDELEQVRAENNETRKKQEGLAVSADESAEYGRMFDAFSGVVWDKPESSRGRTYDDGKFFASLRDQANSGRKLSEKQLAVLARLAGKYKVNLPEGCMISAPAGADGAAAAQAPEVLGILTAMEKITKWGEPVKKGRRTFDDKEFYESLRRQSGEGKVLSSKQVFALKKMAAKYGIKSE